MTFQITYSLHKNQLQAIAYLMGSNSFESLNRFVIKSLSQNGLVAKQKQ